MVAIAAIRGKLQATGTTRPVALVADRLAVLYDGHLAAEGTPEEVRASPDPYVQHFLSMWFAKQ